MKEGYGGWAMAYRQHCWRCLLFISHRTFQQGVRQNGGGIASWCACGVGWRQSTFWLYSADRDLKHCCTRHWIFGTTHKGSKPWIHSDRKKWAFYLEGREVLRVPTQVQQNGSHNCICTRRFQNRSGLWKVKGGPKQEKVEVKQKKSKVVPVLN
jgi:hypothetical protein